MNVTSTTTDSTKVSNIKTKETSSTSASFKDKLDLPSKTDSVEKIIEEYKIDPWTDGELAIAAYEKKKEDFIKKHEENFKKEYPFYEKYKDIFTPKYSNYTREKANNICRDLDAEFPEYKDVLFTAMHGGSQEDKDKLDALRVKYQAYNRYLTDKYDLDMGIGMPSFTQEGNKAFNYAVYEQLENGVSISDATTLAIGVASSFGGEEASSFTLMSLMGYPKSMDEAMSSSKEKINYDKQIDLSEYGFEHDFFNPEYHNKFGTDKEGIKARILYDIELYSFLLENEGIVDKLFQDLKDRAREDDTYIQSGDYEEDFKSGFSYILKVAELAKDIYEKHSDKIFSNSEQNSLDKELSKKAEITKIKIDISNNKDYITEITSYGLKKALHS